MQQQQQQKGGGGATAVACKAEEGVSDPFPAGLRVLVVDDDTACRRILEQQLRKCHYQVTTCRHARIALSLLRERKGGFDLVISDVHMPDMDGFKLLEHVGLEMDLPVIMMSADERTSAVMRGIKHGACDYLIKPVRMEELKNIWQHVVRKKWNGSKDNEHSGSLEDSDRQRRGGEEEEYASSVNDGTDSNWKVQKKKRESKEEEDEGDVENDDTAAAKKPRVVWSVELHQQFVSAVNQLGIDKAVPKRILELMNVPGLTRENVASHLQKFRLYLKRLSGVTQQQGGISNPYCGPVESNSKANAIGRLDFQAAAASVNIPSHAMTALQAELLGRPPGTVMLPEMEQHPLVRSSARYLPAERGIAFGQPVKCQSGAQKLFPQTNMVLGDMTSGFATWSPNLLASSCPIDNRSTTINLSGGNMLAQQVSPQQQSQSILSESTHAHSVRQEAQPVPLQSSCLIAPSRSSDSFSSLNNVDPCNTGSIPISSLPSVAFQGGGASVPIMQTSNLNEGIPTVNYSLISSHLSSLPQDIGKLQDGEYKSMPMLNEFAVPAPAPSVSSALTSDEGNSSWKLRNSSVNFMSPSNSLAGSDNSGDIPSSVAHRGIFPDQGQVKNLGYVGRTMSIPSRFAIDDLDSHGGDNLLRKETGYGDDGARGMQEIRLDFVEGSKLETSTMAHSSSSDLMSILSK